MIRLSGLQWSDKTHLLICLSEVLCGIGFEELLCCMLWRSSGSRCISRQGGPHPCGWGDKHERKSSPASAAPHDFWLTSLFREGSWLSARTAPDAKQSKKVLGESNHHGRLGGAQQQQGCQFTTSCMDAIALYERSAQLNNRSLCQHRFNETSFEDVLVCQCEGQCTIDNVISSKLTSVGSFSRDHIQWLWDMRPVRFVFPSKILPIQMAEAATDREGVFFNHVVFDQLDDTLKGQTPSQVFLLTCTEMWHTVYKHPVLC